MRAQAIDSLYKVVRRFEEPQDFLVASRQDLRAHNCRGVGLLVNLKIFDGAEGVHVVAVDLRAANLVPAARQRVLGENPRRLIERGGHEG